MRADLVREHLVAQLHEEARQQYPGDVPTPIAAELDRPLDRLGGLERTSALPGETLALAAELARLGYLARIAETELFERAKGPIEWLVECLTQPSAAGDEAAAWAGFASACAEFARQEPDERPDPGPDASPSWRIPGPGGHVRHYLAIGAAAELGPKDSGGNPQLPRGIHEIGELKRCWLYGFLLRCCEESLSGERPPT